MAIKRDYYEILGVDRSATEVEIKSAYRKLAMKWHPDRNPGNQQAEEKFKAAAEAYSVLSDPDRRAAYDRSGHASVSGASAGAGPSSGFGVNYDGFPFGDIFDDFFNESSQRNSSSRVQTGEDLEIDVRLTLEEAFTGKHTTVQYSRLEPCESCHGKGGEPGTRRVKCHTCNGTGETYFQQGFFSMRSTCRICQGSGEILSHPCRKCKGKGRVLCQREITVKIPAGVEDGGVLRIPGNGGLVPDGLPGDLHVVIHIAEHAVFTRKGCDLYTRLPISFVQAALGTDISVKTLDGETKLHIPQGTQSGRIFHLHGKGMPSPSRAGRGDLMVEISLLTPTRLSEEQRRLLQQFAELDHHGKQPKKQVKPNGVAARVIEQFGVWGRKAGETILRKLAGVLSPRLSSF